MRPLPPILLTVFLLLGGTLRAEQLFRAEEWLQATADLTPTSPPVELVTIPELGTVYKLHPHLYVGTEPPSPRNLRLLRRAGVRTVLSTDAPSPDIYAADNAGLRSAHVPLRAGFLDMGEVARLVQVARGFPRPIYLHGAAGDRSIYVPASYLATFLARRPDDQTLQYLDETPAETDDVAGLVSDYLENLWWMAPEAAASGPAEFPLTSPQPALAETMKRVGMSYASLANAAGNEWEIGPGLRPTTPAFEAQAIAQELEGWRSVHRPADADFVGGLDRAIRQARELNEALRAGALEERDRAWALLGASCQTCHAQFRDREPAAR